MVILPLQTSSSEAWLGHERVEDDEILAFVGNAFVVVEDAEREKKGQVVEAEDLPRLLGRAEHPQLVVLGDDEVMLEPQQARQSAEIHRVEIVAVVGDQCQLDDELPAKLAHLDIQGLNVDGSAQLTSIP